ncbi:MAG: CRISPR-associated endonuclease Cas1 [Petrotogales bacterium]
MEEAVDIVISGYGRRLGISGECVAIYQGKNSIENIPLFRVRSVTVEGKGVSLTTEFILQCAKEGIIVLFTNKIGDPDAILSSPHFNATITTRRNQIKALDSTVGFSLSKIIVASKIHNQAQLLKYAIKNKKKNVSEEITSNIKQLEKISLNTTSLKDVLLTSGREKLLGIEGNAGRIYWEAFSEICSADFGGRIHRNATDPINQAINYGYGILYRVVWTGLLKAGLEPFAGLLHTDRPGKPSMVLDVVEEFRAPIVDRVILAIANRKQPIKSEGSFLTAETRSIIAKEVIKRFETKERYKGAKFQLYSIIVQQCRAIASHLRNENIYKPYKFKW